MASTSASSAVVASAQAADESFVVRNLDTGEVISVPIDGTNDEGGAPLEEGGSGAPSAAAEADSDATVEPTAAEVGMGPATASEPAEEGHATGPDDDEPPPQSAPEDPAPAATAEQAPAPEERDAGASPFVIRNLDTGEAITIPIDDQLDADKVRARLTFGGTLSSNTEAWTALKAETRGLLEKLASKTTLSFRSYQLCVWQERYVFAEDEGLYYQHLSTEMVPDLRGAEMAGQGLGRFLGSTVGVAARRPPEPPLIKTPETAQRARRGLALTFLQT